MLTLYPHILFFSNIGSYLLEFSLILVKDSWLVPGLFMMLLPLLELSLDPSWKNRNRETGTLHQERRREGLSRS